MRISDGWLRLDIGVATALELDLSRLYRAISNAIVIVAD